MTRFIKWPSSSVARKQIVACTGLLILCFVLTHLGGNLLIFAGPETFNAYAAKLASVRPILFFFEIGLIIFKIPFISTAGINHFLFTRNSEISLLEITML